MPLPSISRERKDDEEYIDLLHKKTVEAAIADISKVKSNNSCLNRAIAQLVDDCALLETRQRQERCELRSFYCELMEGLSEDLADAEKETDRRSIQIVSLCNQLGSNAPSLEAIRVFLSGTR
ncbi:hypothetical protein HYPSUDRAFT_60171 [Hypholoma sublateritium FD-334 SS-4]|uniref:Uncharacterized protein n=1 Tax=Hypholoma sublateritium (strain FD-334 SS-4) TaxID=945553 RepID=A0A0D2N150_HYPSF|nr:hypothetical protein HYPSUDRAFT_60171 [Hypholoma sublateritium FD-334 SS-4]